MADDKPIIVVGAGLSGATLARKFADDGKNVIVIDKRDHIAGNVYDYVNEYGILVQKYGAHIYHDSDDETWQFVNRFTKWLPYVHIVKSYVDGKLVPIPANIDTFNVFLNDKFKNGNELKQWIENQHTDIVEPKNSEESALKRIGSDIVYQKMFKNYTKKQWNKDPSDLDPSVMNRIPVRFDHNEKYFSDKYEGIPEHGYTAMVKNMLDHKNIRVILGRDFSRINYHDFKLLFFSGKIDSFFREKYGTLEYRSLEFESETLKQKSFQNYAVINYPDLKYPFTRIIEHKKFYNTELPYTTITKEYSSSDGEPYYPVLTDRNKKLYKKYEDESKKMVSKGIYFIGRLGQYKYFNMNQAIKAALNTYKMLNQ